MGDIVLRGGTADVYEPGPFIAVPVGTGCGGVELRALERGASLCCALPDPVPKPFLSRSSLLPGMWKTLAKLKEDCQKSLIPAWMAGAGRNLWEMWKKEKVDPLFRRMGRL